MVEGVDSEAHRGVSREDWFSSGSKFHLLLIIKRVRSREVQGLSSWSLYTLSIVNEPFFLTRPGPSGIGEPGGISWVSSNLATRCACKVRIQESTASFCCVEERLPTGSTASRLQTCHEPTKSSAIVMHRATKLIIYHFFRGIKPIAIFLTSNCGLDSLLNGHRGRHSQVSVRSQWRSIFRSNWWLPIMAGMIVGSANTLNRGA